MIKWLTIVGMGEDGYEGLSRPAHEALAAAEVIVGSERLQKLLPVYSAERHVWPQPFSEIVSHILPHRGRRTVVLATGDPLNYGVARKLLEIVPFAETTIIPHLSAFSLAAARLGWSLPDCDTLTLHGRDAATLEPFIQPGARLIVLTADGLTIGEVARRLVMRGFGASEMTVLENMGGPRESLSRFRASALPETKFSDLNTLGIACKAGDGATLRARVAGLADDDFTHDGQITKREVRAATLAALAPAPDQLLWDVGAGCGSIAIEWMRSTRGALAIAIEPMETRRTFISENADRLGAPRLRIVAEKAPAAYGGLPAPDAVFIGGGLSVPGVFEEGWARLKPGGRIVVNVVTIEGEMHLFDLQEKFGGELVRIAISVLDRIGPNRALRPRLPVTQWRAVKPW